MKFEDLHIMQQLYLTALYAEGTFKPSIKDTDEVYYDVLNGVNIKLKDLKQMISMGWIVFLDEDGEIDLETGGIVVNYEICKYSGMDEVQIFMSRISKNDESDHFDRFGLSSNLRLSEDPRTEFSKISKLVVPFAATDESAAKLLEVLNSFIKGAEKASQLPEEFYNLVAMDVPARIIIDQMTHATMYELVTSKKKHRRYTPIISSSEHNVFNIDYERKPSASMKIVMGEKDTDFTVSLTNSAGHQEGGTFNVVSERDTSTTVNTVITLLTNIVEDSVHVVEYRPLLRRFLEYFNQGARHVKNNLVLTNNKGARP